MFVVRYTFTATEERQRDILRTEPSAAAKVIPISADVIERRLATESGSGE